LNRAEIKDSKKITIGTVRGLPWGPGKKLYFFATTDEEEFQEVIFFPGSFFVTFFAAKKSKNVPCLQTYTLPKKTGL
jgi:hypothetical protein